MYARHQRRDIRRLYKLSRRQDWCEEYPCCGHFQCGDRFWRHLNLQSLMRGLARPGGTGIAAYYQEERLRLEWKAYNFRLGTAE